jgi:hypothetical protein
MAESQILDDHNFKPTPGFSSDSTSWSILAKFNSSSEPELFMLANELENAEIMSHTLDKGFNMMAGVFNGKEGAVELYVLQKDLEKAQEIYRSQIAIKEEIYDTTAKKGEDWPIWSIFIAIIIIIFAIGFINKTSLFNF